MSNKPDMRQLPSPTGSDQALMVESSIQPGVKDESISGSALAAMALALMEIRDELRGIRRCLVGQYGPGAYDKDIENE